MSIIIRCFDIVTLQLVGLHFFCTTLLWCRIHGTRHLTSTSFVLYNVDFAVNLHHSQWRRRRGREGTIRWAVAPTHKFYPVRNFFLIGKFYSKNTKFGAVHPQFWGANLGAKSRFWAPVISPVRNLQLSVRTLQLSAPLLFLTHDATDHNVHFVSFTYCTAVIKSKNNNFCWFECCHKVSLMSLIINCVLV